ncbi:9250_t:CDS:2, partial [Dentiscutata erythropus]
YLKVGDMICQWCYNEIIVRPSAMMKEHAQTMINTQVAGIEDDLDAMVDTQDDISEAQESRAKELETEELENEMAEDNELIISNSIGKTELDDLLQKLQGLQ